MGEARRARPRHLVSAVGSSGRAGLAGAERAHEPGSPRSGSPSRRRFRACSAARSRRSTPSVADAGRRSTTTRSSSGRPAAGAALRLRACRAFARRRSSIAGATGADAHTEQERSTVGRARVVPAPAATARRRRATCRSTGRRRTPSRDGRLRSELAAAVEPPAGQFQLELSEHAARAAGALEDRRAERDHPRRRDDVPGRAPPRRRRDRRRPRSGTRCSPTPIAGKRHVPAATATSTSTADVPQLLDALAQRPHRPHLPRQHRRPGRADRARHLARSSSTSRSAR